MLSQEILFSQRTHARGKSHCASVGESEHISIQSHTGDTRRWRFCVKTNIIFAMTAVGGCGGGGGVPRYQRELPEEAFEPTTVADAQG